MIEGINHMTLAVRDRDISLAFYRDILGCCCVARWATGAYLTAGSLWLCLMLDAQTRSGPLPEYTHVAFDVRKENFESMAQKIRNSGAKLWRDNVSEGLSLYFLDPDGHKLEIHASTLQDRLNACKQSPYAEMEFYDQP